MGLRGALVDKGRPVRPTSASGERIEGQTVLTPVSGSWFRCRLAPAAGPAAPDAAQSARVERTQTTLLYGPRDENGDPVVLDAESRVEVRSKDLGNSVWEVTGTPTPLRRKRRVLGYEAAVTEIAQPQFVQGAPPSGPSLTP